MLKDYTLRLPKVVYSGENALEKILTIASNFNKAAIFTDKGIRESGLLEYPLSLFKQKGTEVVIFDELQAEPSCEDAQRVIDAFRNSGADLIVAVGGGSVMDVAKLASILENGRYSVRELAVEPSLGTKSVVTLMIPTTAGTGAEATPNSIVVIPEKELKVGIVNPEMIADMVILDARMIKKTPKRIAASTGIDALAHAIECFTSNKANPFSDVFALEALDLILNNIERAYNDPDALEEKNKMLLAAFYAGIAITASGTTAVHALSYPLGGKYHIPHGVSNAMMLMPVLRFNEPVCREKFSQAYDRVSHGAGGCETEKEKSEWLLRRIAAIVSRLEIPTSLNEYGVTKQDIEWLVAAGMDVKRLLNNNMRSITAEDARALYMEVL